MMGLLAEVPCWLASAVSSSCTGVTDALLPRTASNAEKYGKSAGTSDSSSDSRPAPLLLSLSTICLYLFFKAFIFPLHCATVRWYPRFASSSAILMNTTSLRTAA